MALGLSVAIAAPALAVAAPLNEFEAAYKLSSSAIFTGLKGYMEMRTDPATDPDVGYVHISQADTGAQGGDFVAVGTYKGKGAGNPLGVHCDNDFDANWSGYYDGESGEIYWCYDFNIDAYGIGGKPEFKIEHKACPIAAGNSWVVSLGATVPSYNCVAQSSNVAIGLVIGLETASNPPDPTDRNIDVKFTQVLKKSATGWTSFGPATGYIEDDFYSHQAINSQTYNFYLAPLN